MNALPQSIKTLEDFFQHIPFFSQGRKIRNNERILIKVVNTGENIIGKEFEIKNNSGVSRFVRVNAGPVYDKQGKIVAAVTTGGKLQLNLE